MNYYHLKSIKVYSVVVFFTILFSLHVLAPNKIYAQQDNQSMTESAASAEKNDITAGESTEKSIAVKDENINDKTDIPGIESNIPKETISQSATTFKSLDIKKSGNGLEVIINTDGIIKDYNSFTLNPELSNKLPARIVFDIFKIKSPFKKEQNVPVNTKWVSRIRHYASPDKFRVVLDTKKEFLKAYHAEPISTGLLITIGKNLPKRAEILSKSDIIVKNDEKKKNKLKPAWVDKIDFLSEENGKSTITIGTTHPVEYSIQKANEKLLHLKLNNTNISTKQKRPIITSRFKSAVDGIWPIQTKEMKKYSIIAIELREAVSYDLEQSGDLIKINFESSKMLPKPEKLPDIPAWQEILENVPKETIKQEITVAEPKYDEADVVKDISLPGKKFTGEKIALDFYDTDIKNVFRILKEVSGKNFAIDKNVSGKVTLSLEKPVPWDQALDLVLRMNQLGVIQEGNIVRIATLETIKKEQELRQAAFIAEKKSKEQEKELEPLIVEYIPINYSNAKSEILPHLEKLKTKDRGNISVDERSNLIIMTDVDDVIMKAKEIVRRLDKVTPQVVIEARIVEASANFSKEIGVIWSAGAGPNSSSSLGGNYEINSAVNFPITEIVRKGVLGFDFSRITGSPFLLNAKLEAMEAAGEGKIVSSPKIATLDNKEATIKQGLRYPYNKLDTSGNTTTVFEDVDLELKVKPHVTPDNRISMLIKIKKKDLSPNLINNQQAFTTKEAETELLVNDGDTIVIGGIIKTTKNTGGSAIPGLSRIPILGDLLFKSTTETDNKEELLIFITPKIVTLEQKV